MSGEGQDTGYRLARGVRLRREAFGGVVFEPRSGLLLTVGPAVIGLLESLSEGGGDGDEGADRAPSANGAPPPGFLEGLCRRGVLVAVSA